MLLQGCFGAGSDAAVSGCSWISADLAEEGVIDGFLVWLLVAWDYDMPSYP